MNTKRIFIIGMPGSGKTTIGQQLSEALSLPFYDLDHLIEEKANSSISEIFSGEGEAAFRENETQSLKHLIKYKEKFILALGGGTPCFNDNIELINQSGLSVFINVSEATLAKRLKNDTSRPLVKNASNISSYLIETLKERIKFYRQATLHFQPEKENLSCLISAIEKYSE